MDNSSIRPIDPNSYVENKYFYLFIFFANVLLTYKIGLIKLIGQYKFTLICFEFKY